MNVPTLVRFSEASRHGPNGFLLAGPDGHGSRMPCEDRERNCGKTEQEDDRDDDTRERDSTRDLRVRAFVARNW